MGMLIKKLGVVLCAVFLLVATADGETILDQESYREIGGFTYNAVGIYRDDTDVRTAQTFTVGLDGLLDSVDIRVFHLSGNNPLEVHILPTTGSYYAKPVYDFAQSLAVVTISASEIPGHPFYGTGEEYAPFVHVDFRDCGICVSEGDQLAIGLRSTNGKYGWICGGGGSVYNTYPQGKGYNTYDTPYPDSHKGEWHGSAYDTQFRTYVNIPEPSSAVLILSLCLMFCGVCRGLR